jgi:uncharacterized membrane protein
MHRSFGRMFIFAGIMHFVIPKTYESIMPDYLPAHHELVLASGVAEIVSGAAVLNPSTRRLGSKLSIATLIAVFPANLHMALHPERYKDIPGGRPALLGRLPLQLLLIAWARAAGRS